MIHVRRSAALIALLGLTAASAQTMGPRLSSPEMIAREALTEARKVMARHPNLPRQNLLEIGLLQAILGDTDGGVATICSVSDDNRPGGARWQALEETARVLTRGGQLDAIKQAAERQRGADRAALLMGMAQAHFDAGEVILAAIVTTEAGEAFPGTGAAQLVGFATELNQAGKPVDPNLLSKALDLIRRIPADARTPDGKNLQAEAVLPLVRLHATAGHDDAATEAAEVVADPSARQEPLLVLAGLQAVLQRYQPARDTAFKLSTTQVDPESGASLRVAALCRVALAQHVGGQQQAAAETLQMAVAEARRAQANDARRLSLVACSDAFSALGLTSAARDRAAEALAVLRLSPPERQAISLFKVARALFRSGADEVARTTFETARIDTVTSKSLAAYDAAIAIPASVGLTSDARAALALREKKPEWQREGRLLLVRALAEAGYRQDAVAVAREFPDTTREDQSARVAALAGVCAGDDSPDNATLLAEALQIALEVRDRDGILLVSQVAADKHLAAIAIEALSANLELPEANSAAAGAQRDQIVANVARSVRAAVRSGTPAAGLATASKAAAAKLADPVARAAALTVFGQSFAAVDARQLAEELMTEAADAARQAPSQPRRVQALAELGSQADEAGFAVLAANCFSSAGALIDEAVVVDPTMLAALSECQTAAGRSGAERFLLRAVMAVPSFGRDGSSDLWRLSRVAAYAGLAPDAMAIARRIDRPEQQINALLNLARLLAGRPVTPMRARDFFPLPATVTLGRG